MNLRPDLHRSPEAHLSLTNLACFALCNILGATSERWGVRSGSVREGKGSGKGYDRDGGTVGMGMLQADL